MEQLIKRMLMGLSLVCITCLCAHANLDAAETEQTAAMSTKSAKPDTTPSAPKPGTTLSAPKPDTPPSAPKTWHIAISPDMPEPYIEVLRQYEDYIDTCIAEKDTESVQERLWHGEWPYVYDELGVYAKATPNNSVCYALKDLSGDGFPELIMAQYWSEAYPYAIYHYNEEKGVEMSYFVSSYFSMIFCENGILEVDSAGAGYSTITYLQYLEDAQDWVILDKTAVENTWDNATDTTSSKYFKLAPGENGDPDIPISEAEYRQIAEKYAAKPMTFKWIPLVYNETDPWYSYAEDENFIYEHDFMTSRDEQGFHWWIYLEAAYIMRDYGRRIGYDFMAEQWTVERIWPIKGGYYNILLSQDHHDVVLNVLCHPDEKNRGADRRYVVLYAQYENGSQSAGYNDAVSYDTQLEWRDFDYHERFETPPIENPFGDLYETSIYQPCYIALYRYEQETGYHGKWRIQQIFGRAPFWDYLVESDDRLLWICTDLDDYTYVPFHEKQEP